MIFPQVADDFELLHGLCDREANHRMKLKEFRQLSTDDQLALLYRQGIYVGKRDLDGMIALLYQLDSFYVEVIYKEYRSIVNKINTSESTELLQFYLPNTKLKI